jgi:hypothetical protein
MLLSATVEMDLHSRSITLMHMYLAVAVHLQSLDC